MALLKVDDKVRVIRKEFCDFGVEAVVAETDFTNKFLHYKLSTGFWHTREELELVEDQERVEDPAMALLAELVANKRPYTQTNANSVGENCQFCKAIIYNHSDPIQHTDDCLISRARKLLA